MQTRRAPRGTCRRSGPGAPAAPRACCVLVSCGWLRGSGGCGRGAYVAPQRPQTAALTSLCSACLARAPHKRGVLLRCGAHVTPLTRVSLIGRVGIGSANGRGMCAAATQGVQSGTGLHRLSGAEAFLVYHRFGRQGWQGRSAPARSHCFDTWGFCPCWCAKAPSALARCVFVSTRC